MREIDCGASNLLLHQKFVLLLSDMIDYKYGEKKLTMTVFLVIALLTFLISTLNVMGSMGTVTSLILKYPAAFMKAA